MKRTGETGKRMVYKRRRKEENPSEVGEMTPFGVSPRPKTMELNGSIRDESYLHLRSRRLERFPSHLLVKKARKNKCALEKEGFDLDEKENVGVLKFQKTVKDEETFAFGENERENRMVEEQEKEIKIVDIKKNEERIHCDDKVEDSFGENDLDFGNMERINRESTPSSLMMSKDEITTRMSSNKATTTIAPIVHKIAIGNPIKPSLQELELFFADAEKHCSQKFINK